MELQQLFAAQRIDHVCGTVTQKDLIVQVGANYSDGTLKSDGEPKLVTWGSVLGKKLREFLAEVCTRAPCLCHMRDALPTGDPAVPDAE